MIESDELGVKLPYKVYCKKNFYNSVSQIIFNKGWRYDAYYEYDTVLPEDYNDPEKSIWIVYNYYGGPSTSGYRFWIISNRDDNLSNRFSDYFMDIQEQRKTKLLKIDESR